MFGSDSTGNRYISTLRKSQGGRILAKDLILKVFDISLIDKSFDGILGPKLRHQHSESEFRVHS